MEYKELFQKYQLLITEINELKQENRILKARLTELECNTALDEEGSKSEKISEILMTENTIEVI